MIIGSIVLVLGQVLALVGIMAQGVWWEAEVRSGDATCRRERIERASGASSNCEHKRKACGAGQGGRHLCIDCGATV